MFRFAKFKAPLGWHKVFCFIEPKIFSQYFASMICKLASVIFHLGQGLSLTLTSLITIANYYSLFSCSFGQNLDKLQRKVVTQSMKLSGGEL